MARTWSSYGDAEKAAQVMITAHRAGKVPRQLTESHNLIIQNMSKSYPGIIARYYAVIAREAPELLDILAEEENSR